jgi:hypothetical protein
MTKSKGTNDERNDEIPNDNLLSGGGRLFFLRRMARMRREKIEAGCYKAVLCIGVSGVRKWVGFGECAAFLDAGAGRGGVCGWRARTRCIVFSNCENKFAVL